MCLWSFITGRYTATAKVNDGRLVLSMPDAETPVVWVMTLDDATTSVLRLESDKQGFYVIKKLGAKTAETVAVYRNRRPALRALNAATHALDRARSLRGGAGGRSRFINTLIVILFIWFALSRLWSLDQDLIRMALTPFFRDDIAAAQAAQKAAVEQELLQLQQSGQQPSQADLEAMAARLGIEASTATTNPAATTNTVTTPTPSADAVGVPLSADEFLKSQQNKPGKGMMQ